MIHFFLVLAKSYLSTFLPENKEQQYSLNHALTYINLNLHRCYYHYWTKLANKLKSIQPLMESVVLVNRTVLYFKNALIVRQIESALIDGVERE